MYNTNIHAHSHTREGLLLLPERLADLLNDEQLHLHVNGYGRDESGEYVADFSGTSEVITRASALLLLAQFPEYVEFTAKWTDEAVERITSVEAREGLRMVKEGSQQEGGEYFPVTHTEQEHIACDLLDALPERRDLPEGLSFLRSDFWCWDALRPLTASEQQLLFALPPEAVVFTAVMNTELGGVTDDFTPRLLGVERPKKGVEVHIHYNSSNIYLVFREFASVP